MLPIGDLLNPRRRRGGQPTAAAAATAAAAQPAAPAPLPVAVPVLPPPIPAPAPPPGPPPANPFPPGRWRMIDQAIALPINVQEALAAPGRYMFNLDGLVLATAVLPAGTHAVQAVWLTVGQSLMDRLYALQATLNPTTGERIAFRGALEFWSTQANTGGMMQRQRIYQGGGFLTMDAWSSIPQLVRQMLEGLIGNFNRLEEYGHVFLAWIGFEFEWFRVTPGGQPGGSSELMLATKVVRDLFHPKVAPSYKAGYWIPNDMLSGSAQFRDRVKTTRNGCIAWALSFAVAVRETGQLTPSTEIMLETYDRIAPLIPAEMLEAGVRPAQLGLLADKIAATTGGQLRIQFYAYLHTKERKDLYCVYPCKTQLQTGKVYQNHVDEQVLKVYLIYLQGKANLCEVGHWVPIRSLGALIKAKAAGKTGEGKNTLYHYNVCPLCFVRPTYNDTYEMHLRQCLTTGHTVQMVMPKRGSEVTIQPKHFFKSLTAPVIVYMDFECIIDKASVKDAPPAESVAAAQRMMKIKLAEKFAADGVEPAPRNVRTPNAHEEMTGGSHFVAVHEPVAMCFLVVCTMGHHIEQFSFEVQGQTAYVVERFMAEEPRRACYMITVVCENSEDFNVRLQSMLLILNCEIAPRLYKECVAAYEEIRSRRPRNQTLAQLRYHYPEEEHPRLFSRCHVCEDRFVNDAEPCEPVYNMGAGLKHGAAETWGIAHCSCVETALETMRRMGDDEAGWENDEDEDDEGGSGKRKRECQYQKNAKRQRVPVLAHNMRRYDAKYIVNVLAGMPKRIRWAGQDYKLAPMDVLAKTSEMFLTITWNNLMFKDSFAFMSSSLRTLVENLEDSQQKILNSYAARASMPGWLYKQKGHFPYEWFDSYAKLQAPKLPPHAEWYSTIGGNNITAAEYANSIRAYNTLGCSNVSDYLRFYLNVDTLALADVFEEFRLICVGRYHLDPSHFTGAPSLAWVSALKITRQPIKLISDATMYHMIEAGVRGGITQVVTHYACSDRSVNHSPGTGYEHLPVEPNCTIKYFDANSMYAWAMQQPLPCGDMEYVLEEQQIVRLYQQEVSTDGPIGAFFEVDLEYPLALHDLHRDFPLAPEKVMVDSLFAERGDVSDLAEPPKVTSGVKLCTTLHHKEHYVVHHRTLKLYEQLGLKITKFHRAVRFEQKPWLRCYIDANIEYRSGARNDFEKLFYKLMNNALFGKTIENVRKYSRVKVVVGPEVSNELYRLVSSNAIQDFHIVNKSFVLVSTLASRQTFNKPIQVGVSILDISKTLLYDMHYNHILKVCTGSPVQAKLMYMDTDSLIYKFVSETKSQYDAMMQQLKARGCLDTGNYDPSDPLYSKVGKGVPGRFKDECPKLKIHEAVFLKAKMYAIRLAAGGAQEDEDNIIKKCKGCPFYVVRTMHQFADYKAQLSREVVSPEGVVLVPKPTQRVDTYMRISSKKWRMFSVQESKRTLNSDDNKRVACVDGVNTIPYGFYIFE